MKKTFGIINVLLIASVFVGNYFYLTVGGLTIKALCSGGFALLGLINLIYTFVNKVPEKGFCFLMSSGLVLAMLGDIVLGSDFTLGASLFALGHICFFIAYCFLAKTSWIDFLIGLAIFTAAGLFLAFSPLLTFSEPFMRWVCLVYALIISLMLGKALANLIRKPRKLTGLLALGSALFVFSDLMLVFDWFIGRWQWTGEACMSTYYPAQCILAFSVYFISAVKEKQ